MERLTLFLTEVVTAEEPFLRCNRGLLVMRVDLDLERAMRDEVGDGDLGRGGGGDEAGHVDGGVGMSLRC